MKIFVRIIGVLILMSIALVIGIPTALSYYDTNTKQELQETVANELGHNASMNDMRSFMKRHTTSFALDEYRHQLGGFLPQTRIDKVLLDRNVGVYLKIDSKTGTFQGSDVEVFYTFL